MKMAARYDQSRHLQDGWLTPRAVNVLKEYTTHPMETAMSQDFRASHDPITQTTTRQAVNKPASF